MSNTEDTQRIEEGWSDERLLIKRFWSRAYLDTEEKHIELLKDYRDKELASLREQLKQKEEVIRELIPIAEGFYDNYPLKRVRTAIEKAKSLTTKDK